MRVCDAIYRYSLYRYLIVYKGIRVSGISGLRRASARGTVPGDGYCLNSSDGSRDMGVGCMVCDGLRRSVLDVFA